MKVSYHPVPVRDPWRRYHQGQAPLPGQPSHSCNPKQRKDIQSTVAHSALVRRTSVTFRPWNPYPGRTSPASTSSSFVPGTDFRIGVGPPGAKLGRCPVILDGTITPGTPTTSGTGAFLVGSSSNSGSHSSSY